MKNYYLMTKAAMALMIALFCCIGAQAEVVTVGEGTTASSYVPCYPNNNYSLSQQIYTADEIGRAGRKNIATVNKVKNTAWIASDYKNKTYLCKIIITQYPY